MTPATWVNGKRTVSGRWDYCWAGDYFIVELDQRDRTTGAAFKRFRVDGETPEWGNWHRKEKP